MEHDETTPGATLDHYRDSVWALHPATMASVAAVLRAGPRALPAVDVAPEPQAARGAPTTGGVAVLRLRGVITPQPSFLSILFGGGGSGLLGFRQQLREAVNADDVSAIVLDIDSPGGSTDLIAETAAELRAAREQKPVVAVANTWAASAAYWLAAQADELIVTPSGEVGSIGVFCAHEDISGLEDQIGIKTTLISAGRYKTEGNPYEPLSDEAREAWQAKVDEFYGLFVADVAKGRGVTASAVRAGYGEGRMVTAKQGLGMDLADRIDTLEATVARLVRNPAKAKRRAAAPAPPLLAETAPTSEGNPEPTPPVQGGQEAPSVPSGALIDVMFAPRRA